MGDYIPGTLEFCMMSIRWSVDELRYLLELPKVRLYKTEITPYGTWNVLWCFETDSNRRESVTLGVDHIADYQAAHTAVCRSIVRVAHREGMVD